MSTIAVLLSACFGVGIGSIAAGQPLVEEQPERRLLLAEMRGLVSDPDVLPPLLEPQPGCCKQRMYIERFNAGLNPDGSPITPPRFGDRGPGTDPTDVLNNTLDIEVAPPGNTITGSNTMTIRSNVNNLTSFTFLLRWNFTVSACTVTDPVGSYTVSPSVPVSNASPPSYARNFNLLRPLNQGDVFTVRVDYNGNLQSGIGLGSVFYGGQNNNSANPGVVCTLSEPYYAATWWPCKDGDVRRVGDNSDKATLNMSITAPGNFTSVSNGLLQGVDVLSGGRKRYRWATNYPMTTYLVFFSTTEYNEFFGSYNYGTGTMPLQFDIYPLNDTPANRAAWLAVPDMLDAFRPVYGLYPFINEKYGIYQFEFSGGQEHQTFTGQGGGGAFIDWITAHELSHQWWGDNLTCKTWSDIWLNEGFATYSEAIWFERKPGSTGQPALQAAMNARRPSASGVNGSVYVPPYDPNQPNVTANTTGDPNRIFNGGLSYDKGGWVLHQLRHIVGDTTFFNILQTYRMAFEGGAPTTADFINVCNTVSGQDLSWYFNPWVFGIGAPTYQYGWQDVVIDGQHYLRLMIKQVQSSSYPFFTMPVDVSITTSASAFTRVVRDSGQTCHFLLPIGANAATAITLDPQNWILEYGKTEVTYVAGPPKVVKTSPMPGSSTPAANAPSTLTVTFSDNVNTAAALFSVTRSGSPVPFTYSYDSVAHVATLDFGSQLIPGTYSVAVSDGVTSVSGALALDGELTSASDPNSLPSGNGFAGGIAAFTFTIETAVLNGSCCATSGACSQTLQGACTGSFLLNGTCSPNTCPAPGACCAADGTCTLSGVIAPGSCAGGAIYQGNGSSCSPNPCPQPVACCAADGSCTLVLAGSCGGTAQGAGSTCSPNPCPQPTGACCCGSSCTITLAGACTGTNRAFMGIGVACGPYSATVPCCRGDYNRSGSAPSVQDIFDFLAGYFASDLCADSNDSGAISVQDIFDFLSAYFGGCL